MKKEVIDTFKDQFPNIKQNVKLADYVTFKIGGEADLFYALEDMDDLEGLVDLAKKHEVPYFVFGGGSNLVFADEGFRGLIIHCEDRSIDFDGNTVKCAPGAFLALVIAQAKQHKLGGITKLTGIPGTIGGAVFGNAGAHGAEISDFIVKVKLFDEENGFYEKTPDELEYEYRSSAIKKSPQNIVIVEVILNLPPLTEEEETQKLTDFRKYKQPAGKSGGSFFKNPSKEQPAGMLIDQAGLKGTTVGDMEVSEVHANFLLNMGKGTQKDLILLAQKIREAVNNRFNITLEPEVMLIDAVGNRIDIL